MIEILNNFNSLLFLCAPLFLLVIISNSYLQKPPLNPSGWLVAYPLYFLFQIGLMHTLDHLQQLTSFD